MLFDKFFRVKENPPRVADELRYSFCGKMQAQVKRLIAGPQVYICNECVSICNEIIADDQHRAESTH